ncbi:MAG: PAS domain-containing sensor histidine kinase [Acidimicrobiales bacterium]
MTERQGQSDLLARLDSAQLLEAAPDGVMIADKAGVIRAGNDMAAKLFGVTMDELLGASVEDLMPPAYRDAHAATRANYSGSPAPRPMGIGLTLKAQRADGSVFPAEISLSPMHIDGDDYVIAAVRDVEEGTAVREELQRVQQDAALAEERERLARDLHDTVIQQVFAVGLSLQSVSGRVEDPATAERLDQAIIDLDLVIRDIRTAIFGLTSHTDWGRGLRGELLRVAADQTAALGFEPDVTLVGSIEGVDAKVGEQLVPTLREALSNVAKHAHANQCDVTVVVEGEELELVVTDDGTGPPTNPRAEGRGLANLASRAQSLGGICVFGHAPTGGSSLEWRVPVVQP